jgi:hypothetical protein
MKNGKMERTREGNAIGRRDCAPSVAFELEYDAW